MVIAETCHCLKILIEIFADMLHVFCEDHSRVKHKGMDPEMI